MRSPPYRMSDAGIPSSMSDAGCGKPRIQNVNTEGIDGGLSFALLLVANPDPYNVGVDAVEDEGLRFGYITCCGQPRILAVV